MVSERYAMKLVMNDMGLLIRNDMYEVVILMISMEYELKNVVTITSNQVTNV